MGVGYVHVSMDISKVQGSLERLEKQYQAYGISIVSGIASDARKVAYERFFDRSSGQLRYDSPARPFYSKYRYVKKKGLGGERTLRHREPLTMKGKQGYVDNRGYRLVNFSLESKSPAHKGAYLSSYPMNLWERPTKNGRPGKFIVTVKLPPLVEALVPKHIAIAEAEMAKIADKAMGGIA